MPMLTLAQAKARLQLYETKARDDDEWHRYDAEYTSTATLTVLHTDEGGEDAFAYMWGDRIVDGYVALQAIMSFEQASR